MEMDCHKRSVDRYIKVKKGNVLLYGLVKVSAVPFRSRDDRFYRYLGVNFALGLLDCDRYIGDIVIPCNIGRAGISFYRKSLYRSSTVTGLFEKFINPPVQMYLQCLSVSANVKHECDYCYFIILAVLLSSKQKMKCSASIQIAFALLVFSLVCQVQSSSTENVSVISLVW